MRINIVQVMASILPLVSIITPAYNRASYLDETIQSVLEQDYPHIEYIVLDDGSTDKTREVLDKYTGRIIWETHPNMGETRTVNKGLSMAHGDILAVVNSDDPLLPHAVSRAVAFMEANLDILVAYADWNKIGPGSEFIEHMQVHEYDYLYTVRNYHNFVGPGAFIRRKAIELAGQRDPEFKYVADFEYWLRIGLYGEFARIPETLATWRVHPDSATLAHKGKAMAREYIRLMEKFYSRSGLPPEVIKARTQAFRRAFEIAVYLCPEIRLEATMYWLRMLLCHPELSQKYCRNLAVAILQILPEPVFKILIRIWHSAKSMLAT